MGYLDLAKDTPPGAPADHTDRHPAYDINDRNDQIPAGWDQVEAERLLADLRAEAARLWRGWPRDESRELFRTLAADLVRIGERYIRDHDTEAQRGWDALQLLRRLRPMIKETADRIKASR
jgi:hypothetical protein